MVGVPQCRWSLLRLTMVLAIAAVALGLPTTATAYNGASGAAYADQNWSECGSSPYNGFPPSPYVCMQNDCTNYASQVMHAGGYRFIAGDPVLNPSDSWYWYSTSMKTTSWYDTASLYYFLVYYDRQSGGEGGGSLVANFVGVTASQTYNALSAGDIIFMGDGTTGTLDHARVEVGYGTPQRTGYQSSYDNSYWTTGDWADQHIAPRYHDFWNGFYQLTGPQAATQEIWEVHIPSTSG